MYGLLLESCLRSPEFDLELLLAFLGFFFSLNSVRGRLDLDLDLEEELELEVESLFLRFFFAFLDDSEVDEDDDDDDEELLLLRPLFLKLDLISFIFVLDGGFSATTSMDGDLSFFSCFISLFANRSLLIKSPPPALPLIS